MTDYVSDSADSGQSTPNKKQRLEPARAAPEASEGASKGESVGKEGTASNDSSAPKAAEKGRMFPQPLSPEDVTCSAHFDNVNKGARSDDKDNDNAARNPKLCEVDLCPLQQPAKRWHTITDKTVAGGRDWTRYIGITICDACFSFFRRNGTFDRSFRKPEETRSPCKLAESSPSKQPEPSGVSIPRDKKKDKSCAKLLQIQQPTTLKAEATTAKPISKVFHAQPVARKNEVHIKPFSSMDKSESKFIAPELSTIPMKARKTDAIYYNSKVGRNGKWCSKLKALRCITCSCRMDRCICRKKKKSTRPTNYAQPLAPSEKSSEPRDTSAGQSGGELSESECSEFEIIEEDCDSSNDSMSWEDADSDASERVVSHKASHVNVTEVEIEEDDRGGPSSLPPALVASELEDLGLLPSADGGGAGVRAAVEPHLEGEDADRRELKAEHPPEQRDKQKPIKVRIPRWRLGCEDFLRPYRDESEQANLDSISEALEGMGNTVRGLEDSLSSIGSSLASQIAELRQTVLETEWESLQ